LVLLLPPAPSDTEVAATLATIRRRVQRLLERHGLEPADDGTGPADRLAEEFPVPPCQHRRVSTVSSVTVAPC